MSEQFLLVIEGLSNLTALDDIGRHSIEAARIAVNAAARRGRTMLADEVLREVDFPASYVAPRNQRLYVKKTASNANLEAVISAQSRRTSLAQFATGAATRAGKKGVRVKVGKGGGGAELKRAFLIRLRAGNASLDTKSNLGLAYRTKDGRPPPGYKPTQLAPNLWLLYGPSVAQVLHSDTTNSGAANELSPDIAELLEREFWRQMDLRA